MRRLPALLVAAALTVAPAMAQDGDSAVVASASTTSEAFASAATACLEATQAEETDESGIERHNWVRSPEQEYPADRAVSFEREGSDVQLYVLKPEKQCLVLWRVTSSGDNGAFIEGVIEAVKDRVTSEFLGATHGPLEGTGNAHVFGSDVASTWGNFRAEDRDATMVFSFIAMNKENLAGMPPRQAATSGQPSEHSRDQ